MRIDNSFKEKANVLSKGKKVEYFNYGQLGHMPSDYHSPKDINKAM